MLDLFNTALEYLKKNKDQVLLFFAQVFVANSFKNFDFNNLCKLVKKLWNLSVVALIHSKETLIKFFIGTKIRLTGTFLVLFLYSLLKLHHAGIIKLSPNKAFAIGLFIFALGLVSALSKMQFTKIEIKDEDDQDVI